MPRNESNRFAKVETCWQLESCRRPEHWRVLEAVDPKRPETGVRSREVAPDSVPGRFLVHEPVRLDLAATSPVPEADQRAVSYGLMKRTEGGKRRQNSYRREAGLGHLSRGSELCDRVTTRRAAELHSGYSEAQRLLLVRVETKLGKVVVLWADAVAELFFAVQRLDADRDSELAKRPLVPLKGLTARLLAFRVPDDRGGDLPQRQRA